MGISVNINRYEWAVFVQKLEKRDFDMVTLAWSLGYSVSLSAMAFIPGEGADPISAASSIPRLDRIIEAARMEFKRREENCMYHRFHQILHQEQPYTFLFCPSELVVGEQTLLKRKGTCHGPLSGRMEGC
jgi:peptide/nickel transport system substrate-binding protein